MALGGGATNLYVNLLRVVAQDGPLPRHMTTTPMAAASQVESAEADAAQQASSGLQLYNTMTRQKEAFVPRTDQGNKVSMYVCGVTVYDLSHIGHARVYVAFDVLYRYLQQLGYDVTYIRNFTGAKFALLCPCSFLKNSFHKKNPLAFP